MGSEHPRRRRVAVVGASGFVGSAVSRALEAQGDIPVPVSAPRIRLGSAVDVLEAATRDEHAEGLAKELLGCDAVVNAAGVPDASSGDAPALLAANAALPGVCARACSLAGIRRFVHVSSAAVQGYTDVLDDSADVEAFSPYARSKIEGERVALALDPGELVIYRPPSVHAPDRRITRALSRIATSPLSSVAAPADSPTPQALVGNVGSAVAFLTTHRVDRTVVHHPSEGLTTKALLELLGARRVVVLPRVVARVGVLALRLASRLVPALAPNVRRLEMLWFGQRQAPSALTAAGWLPPQGREAWKQLGRTVAGEAGNPAPSSLGDQRPLSVLYAVTVPSVAQSFLRGQLRYMAAHGWDVTLACSPGRGLAQVREREGVSVVELTTARDISLVSDLLSLVRWVLLLRRVRPTILNASTPKAALLSLIAGKLTGVPIRIYVVRGLRLESESGPRRRVLAAMERITARCATDVIAVSRSLRDELVRLELTAGKVPHVIASGSSNGVDVDRVSNGVAARDRVADRAELGLDAGTFVVGFIGRIRRDKGVFELCEAFSQPAMQDAVLVTQGDIEDAAAQAALATLGRRHIHLGWQDDVFSILAMSDVLALPTHREGFPNVVLEAAAARVPVVTTDATGAVDSVVHEQTGLIGPVGDAAALTQALAELKGAEQRRREMGERAYVRARSDFAGEVIWSGLESVYRGRVGELPSAAMARMTA